MGTVKPPPNGKEVLVTGINGFIGSALGLQLLEKGYHIRGTARRSASTDTLLQGAYKDYASRVKIFEVADMTVEENWIHAVKGVFAIMHVASPVNFSLTDPDAVIGPAVKGSTSLLSAALNHAGSQLAAVVVTSSEVAMRNSDYDGLGNIGPENWNTEDELTAQTLVKEGKPVPASVMYAASKTEAEKATLNFARERKPFFAISTVLPGLVYGPLTQLPSDPEHVNESSKPVWTILSGTSKELPNPVGLSSYVDVRDVARMHIWCMENPERSAGQRYLAIAGCAPPQAIADHLHAMYPERRSLMVKGEAGKGYRKDHRFDGPAFNVSKTVDEMGLEWIPPEITIRDTAKTMEAWL